MIVKNSNDVNKLNSEKYKKNITKMENVQKETKLFKDIIKRYKQFDELWREKYNKYKSKNKSISNLEKKYKNKDFDDKFIKQSRKIQHNYYKQNMASITTTLNDKFKNSNIKIYFEDKINKR